MRLLIVGLALVVSGTWAQHHSFSSYPYSPLLPIAPLASYPGEHGVLGRISTGPVAGPSSAFVPRPIAALTRPISRERIDPCNPTPCGPNTRCDVNAKGNAQCRCIGDFVPKTNTIEGCKPQCESNSDCPDDYRCSSQKCVKVCDRSSCGHYADCTPSGHQPNCRCPDGYSGDPHISCRKNEPQPGRAAPPAPPLNPCDDPNICGLNAKCRFRGDRAVCSCPIGYEGDPLTNCRRGECLEADDCPLHLTCQSLRCVNPCSVVVCAEQAECTVKNHQPICSCPRGYVGDPFISCRRFNPQELCNPSPCGQNTKCRLNPEQNRAVCSCIDNYIGDPLTGCRPECVTSSECPHNMACRNNICVNPCRDACGDGAFCEVVNSRAKCSCPQYYQGDPYSRCYAECTAHDDCPTYKACYQLKCVNPCEDACGVGADCKVEEHKPICSCPKGYTGHPFEACRPFTPADLCNPNPCGSQADCTPGFDSSGNDRPVCTCPTGFNGNPLVSCQRGECQAANDCPRNKNCYLYKCENPCFHDGKSVCGSLADCNVKDHVPVCSCPIGYSGDPRTECSVGRSSARFTVGRSRRKTVY